MRYDYVWIVNCIGSRGNQVLLMPCVEFGFALCCVAEECRSVEQHELFDVVLVVSSVPACVCREAIP